MTGAPHRLLVMLLLACTDAPAAQPPHGQENQQEQEQEHQHDPAHAPAPAPDETDAHAHTPPAGSLRIPIPPLTDADRASALPAAGGHPAHDNAIHGFLLADHLEAWDADPGTGFAWEGEGWLGKDLDRIWLRSEGVHSDGHTESATLELLYGRSIAVWWDLLAGVRHDFEPGASRDFIALGIQGLAPQWFEIKATAYIEQGGHTAARLEAEYQLLFTNRLILQPRLEIELNGGNDAARGIGQGFSTTEAGLRLRYEFTRRFAPYVGLTYERAFGETADLRRAAGEPVDEGRLVAGVRLWF